MERVVKRTLFSFKTDKRIFHSLLVLNRMDQWQKMLKSEDQHVDLIATREQLMSDIQADLEPVIERFGIQAIQPIFDAEVQTFVYPMTQYPTKITSLNFDKTPEVGGTLLGIKGQYLMFGNSSVINIRKFGGYLVRFRYGD